MANCGGEQNAAGRPTPPARAVDLATIADDDLVAAVLDECQRPLQGRLDRIAAVVRLPDGGEQRLFAQLPYRLRTVGSDGNFLLVGDDARRLLPDGSEAATGAQTERLRRLRTLLDGALFGPLHRARGCRRTAPTAWQLTQQDGSDTRLELRANSLLPARIGDVRIVDYLRTSTTWMVKRAALDGLGECELQFLFDDLDWAPDFFSATPGAAPKPASTVHRLPTAAGEPRSEVPFVVDTPATDWAIAADTGTWLMRSSAYVTLHEELVRQNQHVAGFPILWHDDTGSWLAAPFRRRPQGAAFAAPADWTIRSWPAGRWLVVYPPEGNLRERLADGERRLREALDRQHLRARGAVVAQPFLHLEEGVPDTNQLAAPVVRMSVPVD